MGLGEAWENYLPTNLSKVLDSIWLLISYWWQYSCIPLYRNIRYIIECKDAKKYKNMRFKPIISKSPNIINIVTTRIVNLSYIKIHILIAALSWNLLYTINTHT